MNKVIHDSHKVTDKFKYFNTTKRDFRPHRGPHKMKEHTQTHEDDMYFICMFLFQLIKPSPRQNTSLVMF
jgi:hypothetical protein